MSVTAKEALRQLRKWKSILILLENIYHHISVRWKWHQKKLKKWRSGKPEKTGFIRITWKGKQMASSRKELLDWLKALKDEKVVDIRKVYKNGVTDSVIDSYRSYLKQWKEWDSQIHRKHLKMWMSKGNGINRKKLVPFILSITIFPQNPMQRIFEKQTERRSCRRDSGRNYVLSAGSTEDWKSFVPGLQREAAPCWG